MMSQCDVGEETERERWREIEKTMDRYIVRVKERRIEYDRWIEKTIYR